MKEDDDAMIGALCVLQMDKNTRKRINNCSSVYQAWTTLSNFYESRVEEEQVRLQSKMMAFSILEKDDVEVKYQELRDLREELEESGISTPDSIFIHKVLGALPESWRSFAKSTRGIIRQTLASWKAIH